MASSSLNSEFHRASSTSAPKQQHHTAFALRAAAINRFRQVSEKANEEAGTTKVEGDSSPGSYEKECERIHDAIMARHQSHERTYAAPLVPPFYLRQLHPLSDTLSRLLHHTTKTYEMSMGVLDVEALDDMHLMLRKKIAACGEAAISLDSFLNVAKRTQRAVQRRRQRQEERERARREKAAKKKQQELRALRASKGVLGASSHLRAAAAAAAAAAAEEEVHSSVRRRRRGSVGGSSVRSMSSVSSSSSAAAARRQRRRTTASGSAGFSATCLPPSPKLSDIFDDDEEDQEDESDNTDTDDEDEDDDSDEDDLSDESDETDESELDEAEWQAGGKSSSTPHENSAAESPSANAKWATASSCCWSLPLPQRLEKPLDPHYIRRIVPYPRLSAHLFLSSSRPLADKTIVPVQQLCQSYALAVSRVKSEVELMMWDADSDGRLSEDEMENYVREMVPHMEALRDLTEDVLPFYCCTVSRRIFWDLDKANRSFISIDALLQSDVLTEWLRLQLLPDDHPRSWFGAMVTRQLYEKFLLLDTRNEGTLQVEDLKRYKKGLPTVVDDGLPPDVSPLSSLFVDRYFETTLMMARGEMDFRKFVDFVIAMEMLPQCSRPLFFWNILDLDHTGVLTPMVVNSFFRETHAKVEATVANAPSREIVVQELFDLIPTAQPLLITREEFVQGPQAGLFTAIVIDCLSFWGYENRSSK